MPPPKGHPGWGGRPRADVPRCNCGKYSLAALASNPKLGHANCNGILRKPIAIVPWGGVAFSVKGYQDELNRSINMQIEVNEALADIKWKRLQESLKPRASAESTKPEG